MLRHYNSLQSFVFQLSKVNSVSFDYIFYLILVEGRSYIWIEGSSILLYNIEFTEGCMLTYRRSYEVVTGGRELQGDWLIC